MITDLDQMTPNQSIFVIKNGPEKTQFYTTIYQI
jgi:hypothetical protein